MVLLGEFMAIGMQIRAFVKARIGADGMPSGYYDFIPASIKPAGSLTIAKEAPAHNATATLTNALLNAKGATSGTDAYFKLVEAKCPADMIQQFLAADKAGTIKYPI